MKKITMTLLCLTLFSCVPFYNQGDPEEPIESAYEPVVIDRNDLDATIAFKEHIEMTESSKIYIFNDYIFINDKRKGFHIFDNSDTSNPIKKTFLNIPGATDIAIRNNVFFINQATDLVSLTIDVTTGSIKINKREENVFPEILSPDGFLNYEDSGNSVVVNWIEK